MKKIAVISLSGGMDSTCLMIRLLAEGYKVYGLSVNYGQKHKVELQRLWQNILYLEDKKLPLEKWNLIDLSVLGTLFNSSLLNTDTDVPVGHYEEENMKSTVVPNRNAIFSSLLFGYALSIANKENCAVDICLGVHSGDHAIYPDCRPEFYKEIEKAFKSGNWDSERVNFTLPYLEMDKTSILEDCLKNCEILNLDFDTVLGNTNTSYNPDENGNSSGTSGADVERVEAFINIGRKDPVPYVNGWEETVKHVKQILSK